MKKRHYAYLLLIFAIIITIIAFRFSAQDKDQNLPTTVTENVEDIRHYYYRSVPGLMRAEQLDLVKPIHKTFDIPDTHSSLKIDRLWYNDKNAFIFYHVDNIDTVAYLGGFFSSCDNDEIIELDPREFIGTPKEKGIFINNSFYSFLKIPPIKDIDRGIDKDIDGDLLFTPSLFIEDLKNSFEPINISWELVRVEEPIEIFELDTQIEIGENNINLDRLEAGVSYSKVYFSYSGSNPGTVYGLKADIFTNTGESFAVDNNTVSINKDEGEYYIEMQPFNELPSSLRIQLESISVIGEESIHCTVDTHYIKKKKGIQTLDIPLDRVMETDIILNTLNFRDNEVDIGLLYNKPEDGDNGLFLEPGCIFYNDQKTLLSNTNNDEITISNVFSIQNNLGQTVESGSYIYPQILHDKDDKIHCIIPLDFWEKSQKIFISIHNITYRINVNQSIEIGLLLE